MPGEFSFAICDVMIGLFLGVITLLALLAVGLLGQIAKAKAELATDDGFLRGAEPWRTERHDG